jgi:hypothetical protein
LYCTHFLSLSQPVSITIYFSLSLFFSFFKNFISFSFSFTIRYYISLILTTALFFLLFLVSLRLKPWTTQEEGLHFNPGDGVKTRLALCFTETKHQT